MSHRGVGALLYLFALIAYIRTGRIARRSPFYSGLTVVLSWIGLVVQCVGWIAIVQGFIAVSRWAREHGHSDEAPARMRRQYIGWTIAYFCLFAAAGIAFRK